MSDVTSGYDLASQIRKTTGDLPPMPHVAAQVMERVGSDDSTVEELARIISQDSSLATRVLKIANSLFYGRGQPIKTLPQAVVQVGFNLVRSVVTTAVVRGLTSRTGKNEELLWEHSVGCALASRVIALRTRACDPEQAFLVGLLHDLGKTLLLLKVPERMGPIVEAVAAGREGEFCALEEGAFGFHHAVLGQLLAREWKFGPEIEEAIGCHHAPEEAVHVPRLCRVLHLADALCHKMEIGPLRRPDLDLAGHESARELGLGADALEEIRKSVSELYEAQKNTLMV